MKKETSVILICLYVDDLLVIGSDLKGIEFFKAQMMQEFNMTDLGTLAYFLGLEFVTTSKGILLHQQKYATDVLKRFHMADCNPANTPIEVNTKLEIVKEEEEEAVDPTIYKQLVGSLRYLCNSRPDLSFVVGLINRFINNPKKSHLTVAKRILRYVKGTLEYGVLFPRKTDQRTMSLLEYSDSDWCGDKTDRKSTIRYLFKFLGAPIS